MSITMSGIFTNTEAVPLPITSGGTGQATAQLAINALLPSQASNSGKVLTTDGTNVSWVTGGGGGGGTVTTVSVTTANGVSGSVANATTTPSITLLLGAITPTSVAASGTVSGSNLSGTNTGDQTITLTGDVTGSGAGSFATILATVNGSPQTDAFRKITVNGKGLTTASSAVTSGDIASVLGYTPGSVTTLSVATANGVSGSVANATTTPSITLSLGAITPTSVASTGAVSGSNLSGTNTGDQTITLTGDITGSGTGSFATTLPTVNVSAQSNTFRKITVNGKGLTTATSSVVSADITTALGYTPVNIAGDTMTGSLLLNADPTQALGAVTKQYADAISAGINVHGACKTATTAALTPVTYNNGASGVGATLHSNVDGSINFGAGVGGVTTLAIGDRVLVKDQSTTLQNGIYTVTVVGQAGVQWILTRATDFDGSPTFEIEPGDLTYIELGTLAGTQWVETDSGSGQPGSYIVVGTDAIGFSQFSGPGTYTAGAGISITGTSIANTGVTSAVAGTNIAVSGATGAVTFSVTGTVPSATTATTAGSVTGQANSATITADTANTASTIVLRNASGNFSAGTITAALTGAVNGTIGATTQNSGQFTNIGVGIAANGTNGDVSIARSGGTTGYIWFGNTGTKCFGYDGTTFLINGSINNIGIGIAPNGNNGDLSLSRGGGDTAALWFGNTGSKYLYWDGTTLATSGMTFSSASGFIGPLTGNVTGNVTGAVTGNASTATTLQTARAINGVSFDGSAAITVTAAAGTLTGTTLASNVVSSSLTSVGTLAALTVTASIVGSVTGSAATATTATTATNVAGGAAGSIPYQSAANTTAMLGIGSNGNILSVVAGALAWSAPGAAAASALTGTTMASNVVSSSLTSVGTLTSLAVTGAITTNSLTVGYLEVPQRATGTTTLVAADSGKHIFTSAGGQTYTIPANSSVAYAIGTAISFVNQSTTACTIAITTDTMYFAGTAGTTGSRTLGQYGVATALKIGTTTWIISGTSLT